MSFDSYKNIAEVLQEYRITSCTEKFIIETHIPIRESFREDLDFSLKALTWEESESAICEAIIFPSLKEIYRSHCEYFTLWSHKQLNFDEKLSGTPDYIIAQKSPLGKEIFSQPFLVAVEAKKDDFIKGWGQCLAEIVAIQKINQIPTQNIFGIVTNGQFWQFGKLRENIFTKEVTSYTLSDLEQLFAAIHYIFLQCRRELELIHQKSPEFG
ncbi:hypothetical protein [Calothrix sp. 336/3]|uniref:hypothetical protein n=1 Tax=Calothrix sp. 336/3 TaxID=1337936 RepID=UPI0004E33C8D|nr:hypothetical protein [Calothrix sp. 336/3]AKG21835.1 hypothetical protein IJ00_11695 [Calothrix sp. 336/3]